MRIVRYRPIILGIVGVTLLVPSAVQACPKCFESTPSQVLRAYYVGALLLSMMPFGIIGSILAWLYLHQRRTRSNKPAQDTPSGNGDGCAMTGLGINKSAATAHQEACPLPACRQSDF